MSENLEWVVLDPPEKRRRYIFPEFTLEFENVVRICVRPSGNHRIETEKGDKAIVAPGWRAILIDTDK